MTMELPERARLLVRIAGGFWILVGPELLLMAAITAGQTVRTVGNGAVLYAVVALGGLLCGAAAIGLRMWAARGLHLLSWLVAVSCFGGALLGTAMLAAFGTAFLAIALLLGHAFRLRKRQRPPRKISEV
jgi:hypothetical protein